MKKLLVLFLSALFVTCASTILTQPHIPPMATITIIDADAGIYIIPADLTKEYSKNSLLSGKIRMPLGTPLRDLSQETFSSFFSRVFYIGNKLNPRTPFIIEIGLGTFEVTFGLDTHLTIICTVTENEIPIFARKFEGSGSGTAWARLLGEKLAGEQIRKSAEEAFKDAFKKIQIAFEEYLRTRE